MARGSASKEKITQILLKIFPGSFLNGKEFRIPCKENGEIIQIKVALTCAKTNVGEENPNECLGESKDIENLTDELTKEEKDFIVNLLNDLNIEVGENN